MEKNGFLKCQMDIVWILKTYEADIFKHVKFVRRELDSLQGMARQEKLMEFNRLLGELDALRSVWTKIHSLAFYREDPS